MISALDTATFALNNKPVGDLKSALKPGGGQSIEAIAKQFEGMFLNIMLRGMRSGGGNSLLDNNETKLYTELLDQEFAKKISEGRGLGLADALVKQITRSQAHVVPSADAPALPMPLIKAETPKSFAQGLPGGAATPLPLKRSEPERVFPLPAPLSAPIGQPSTAPATPPATPKDFVSQFLPAAVAAGRDLGVAPQGLLAQAALESGWGKREIKHTDGSNSFNLFGIKADKSWQGPVAQVLTTEYVNDAPTKRVERFRAYASYEAGFQDYVSMMKKSPRYSKLLNVADANQYAQGLQKAGYATDPHYAAKLSNMMQGKLLREVA